MGAQRLIRELRRHVSDPRVLEAIRSVPRDAFVPPEHAHDAWSNVALPIGSGQTISQPLVVARMCEALELRGDERVLDVGTGSGYHAAVLASLCAHVWSIERLPELGERAAAALETAGVTNVTLAVGDGARGLPATGPYDAINVAAAAKAGLPPALVDQLGAGGRLIGPEGAGDHQWLVLVRRTPGGHERTRMERVRFVPLV